MADCAALGFKPKLSIKLEGGTKRNRNPALTAVVRARPGDANIGAAQVTLPHSAFLDQSHIKTVCSSSHPLPDMVVALHSGKIDVNLVGRIDTGKGGGIRSSFESVPDAPVTSFTLQMAGGKKGLIVNSTNLCKSTSRADAVLQGQNGRAGETRPVVGASCGKGAKRKRGSARSASNR